MHECVGLAYQFLRHPYLLDTTLLLCVCTLHTAFCLYTPAYYIYEMKWSVTGGLFLNFAFS